MKYFAALFVMLALSGCANQAPMVQIQRVEIPVKVPCIDKVPERPTYLFGKGEKLDSKGAALLLADDFEKAEKYGILWESAAAGCIKPLPKSLP